MILRVSSAKWTRLFNLDTAPSSTSELQMRLAEIRRMRAAVVELCHAVANVGTHGAADGRASQPLLRSISAFLGNKQAQQSIAQMNATISKTLAIQAAQQAAFQQAGGFDKMEELLTIESLQRINEATMADWPRR